MVTLALCCYIPFAQYIIYQFEEESLNKYLPINICFIVWSLMYPLSYIYIDLIAGISWIPLAIITWFTANYLFEIYSFETLLIIFVISWIAQFLSHGLIEERRPALLDSLYESIVLAPFFWHFEILLFPLGLYKEEKKQIFKNAKKIQKEMDINDKNA